MIETLAPVLKRLLVSGKGKPVSGIDPAEQFRPAEKDPCSVARNINAAFLLMMSDPASPAAERARGFVDTAGSDEKWAPLVEFYRFCIAAAGAEIEERSVRDDAFRSSLEALRELCSRKEQAVDRNDLLEALYRVFFPEGSFASRDRKASIADLREKRRVTVTSLNENPVRNPAREILFTANALITVPPDGVDPGSLDVSPAIKKDLAKILEEEQLFWYDHPVPVGTPPDGNEVIYGLERLDEALEYEAAQGNMGEDETVDCAVSVTVTHNGLHRVARPYIEEELAGHGDIRRLRVHVFTETDTGRIIDEVLMPAAREFLGIDDPEPLKRVFGVDGRYGRHYSFLKAIAPFWKIFISDSISATFKIDLDQVFPQGALKRETGSTAFGHFMSPLWGARGTGSDGRPVSLGFLAGALVNEKDFGESLFTPDVAFPDSEPYGDEMIFHSRLPQALSTEAEMAARYGGTGGLDGKSSCIQRIHVTGGTNGILVDPLRKYRPFAPTFIGRAEDQSYLLSVLYREQDGAVLRYVHRDGLIMRHDKEAFAGEAIEAAKIGKLIGDYIRILLFSWYAEALPWPVERIKDAVDPFTGCFISYLPVSVVFLRFCLKTAAFYEKGDEQDGREFSLEGAERILELLKEKETNPGFVRDMYEYEKKGWDLYYDILDAVEKKIREGDGRARELAEQAKGIVAECRLKFNSGS